ncbi:ABC transporter permease [Thermogemmatispora carboxidivorans]|uniref:ABC transporter permease n=1 Tax=Thermogemmatispora carboxidivorans TaxID=1382306 RepID=UPI00069AAA59|nr:ABC transporter permease subunit [Thermogemmatispora carboxidivorans]
MGWLVIARFTIKEIVRRRIFAAVVVLTVLLLGLFTLLLNALVDNLQRAQPENMELLLLGIGALMAVLASWSVYLQSSLMTLLLTAGMLSGEIEAGTLAVIVPKPLHRVEVVFGKWLAYALVLAVYTAVLELGFLGVIYWKTGYWPDGLAQALGLLELGMLSLLALLTAGSASLPTLANGAIAALLFLATPIASFAQVVTQITGESTTVERIRTVFELLMPADALWHAASAALLPPVAQDLIGIRQVQNLPIIGAEALTPAMALWVALYIVVLPLLGMLRFSHRDL